MGIFRNISNAGRALVDTTSGFSKKFIDKVFPKGKQGKVAKLDNTDVETIDHAKKATDNNFFENNQWKSRVETLDLTEATKLPENYENPGRLKTLRVHARELNKDNGLLSDPKLTQNLPKRKINVQVIIKKSQLSDLLAKTPKDFTEAMARTLIGGNNVSPDIKPMSHGSIAKHLLRIDQKFHGDERKMPSKEVREMLVGHLLNNASDDIAKQVRGMKNILQGTQYEKHSSDNDLEKSKTVKKEENTQLAIKQVKKQALKGLDKNNISGDHEKLADDIFAGAKKAILDNAKKQKLGQKINRKEILQVAFKDVLASVDAKEKKALEQIILKAVQTTETMYEISNNSMSKVYKRLTKLDAIDDHSNRLIAIDNAKLKDLKSQKQKVSFQQSAKNGLDSLPKTFLKALTNHEYKVQLGKDMQQLGYTGEISGDHYGRNHENSPAKFIASNKKIAITQKYEDKRTGNTRYIGNKDKVQQAVRHETGHAIFDIIENHHPELLAPIKEAYLKDIKNLNEKHPSIQSNMAYQTQNAAEQKEDNVTKGLQEGFANAFAVKYGGDYVEKSFKFSELEKAIGELEAKFSTKYRANNFAATSRNLIDDSHLQQANRQTAIAA